MGNMNGSDWYHLGFVLTAPVVFAGCWIYCVANYGFLIGVGLGWFPSFIAAIIAGAAWPVIAFAILALMLWR